MNISRCKTQSGFTLIEIMVVVVIIAITVTLVTLNLERDVDHIANLEAQRFAKLVEHVRDESIISGKTFAIDVDEEEKSYQFLQPGETWTPIQKDDVLRKRYFPEYLSVRFDILNEVENKKKSQERTLLVIQDIGEVTPFTLIISGEEFEHIVDLDDSQNVKVERVSRETS